MPSRPAISLESFDEILDNIKDDIASRLAATKSLFEQIDTSKWSPHDLRVYESLVEERLQLEIDHHKLATNDIALRSGQRKVPATDLRQSLDVDANFKYDSVYSTYRYYGANPCLLEHAKSCSHDLCRRAVSEGLPYLEYDTIMHYDMRISTAKTPRMKDALRKQRDVQLLKDAKAVEAWKTKCINKMGSLGQEAQDSIVKTATQITGWKFSSIDVKIESDTPAEQVGRALSQIRAATLSADENLFGQACLDRLRNSKTSHCHWKIPSPYMEYLSPILTDQLEAAIVTIHRILETNATLHYEPYSCLKSFLKDFRQLVQWTELPHRKMGLGASVGLALDDVKVALTLDEMRSSPHPPPRETLPRDPPQSPLCKALKECLDVENRAQVEMWRVQTEHALRGSDPQAGLAEVKRKGIDRSPMPSVSSIALGRLALMNKEYCIINTLLSKAKAGISTESLIDATTDHLRRIIGDDWVKCVSTCRSLRAALQVRPLDDEHSSVDELAHEQLEKALSELDKRSDDLYAEYNEKLLKETKDKSTAPDDKAKFAFAGMLEKSTEYYLVPGMSRGEDTQNLLVEYAKSIVHDPTDFEPVRLNWRDLIYQNISRGIGEAFRVYQYFCKYDMCGADDVVLNSLTDESNEVADLLCKNSEDIGVFLNQQYQRGCCLASTFLRLVATLPKVSLLNPNSVLSILDSLNKFLKKSPTDAPREWEKGLPRLCHIFLHTHGYLTIESIHTFGRADVEQVALSLVFVLAFSILTVNNADRAKTNLNFVLSFTELIFGRGRSAPLSWCVNQIKPLFANFIDVHHIRCCDPTLCVKYKCALPDVLKRGRLVHSPKVEQRRILGPHNFDTTIHSTKSIGKQHPKRMLNQHKAMLSDLIDQVLKQCSPLEKGKLLKYCAYQIKLLNSSAKQSQSFADLASIDAEFIDLLWRAFMCTEQIRHVTEPSSLNIGMHNLCNIWELVESKQKTCGFMEGYRRGYRNKEDLRLLAYSCAQYAILNGKREAVPAFHRKREKLRQLADELPEQLELFLIDECDALEESTLDDTTLLRQTYLRLEYMYQSDPGFLRLDTRYFAEMLDLDVNQFITFAGCLRVEIELNEGEKSIKMLDNAVEVLVDQTKSAKYIPHDDPNLMLVQAAACRAWQRSPHEEFIFSEDEDDDCDSDTDIISKCLGKQKNGKKLEQEENSHTGCNGDKLGCANSVTAVGSGRKPELRTPATLVESQSAICEEEFENTTATSATAHDPNPQSPYPNLQATILPHSETGKVIFSVLTKEEHLQTEPDDGRNEERAVPKTPEAEDSTQISRLDKVSYSSNSADRLETRSDAAQSNKSPFYNKLLELKASLAITKSVVDQSEPATAAAAAASSIIVPFQHLQQKTELAELQCEYMLKTLMHERSETVDEQNEAHTRRLLDEIQVVSKRVAAFSTAEQEMVGDTAKVVAVVDDGGVGNK